MPTGVKGEGTVNFRILLLHNLKEVSSNFDNDVIRLQTYYLPMLEEVGTVG